MADKSIPKVVIGGEDKISSALGEATRALDNAAGGRVVRWKSAAAEEAYCALLGRANRHHDHIMGTSQFGTPVELQRRRERADKETEPMLRQAQDIFDKNTEQYAVVANDDQR